MSRDTTADRIAIQDVMLTYAASVDERDLERYAGCFTDDVEIVGFGDETLHGRDAWVNYVSAALEKYGATQHLLSPALATIEGDTARVRTDVQATHVMAGSENRFTLWATYFSRMQRGSDGRWRIARHELVVRSTQTD